LDLKRLIAVPKFQVNPDRLQFRRQVSALLEKITRMWQSCDPAQLPDSPRYSLWEKLARQEKMRRLLDRVIVESSRVGGKNDDSAAREKLLDEALRSYEFILRLKKGQMEMVRSLGLLELVQQFAAEARRFDATLSDEDIYQASRNVLTMGLLQALMDLPVRLTPSIFAYSLLYPYSDNYLDDPKVPLGVKMTFNRRFYRRLLGETVQPENEREAVICSLVGMIEGEFSRAKLPQVYESLLAIFAAQMRSLEQARLRIDLLPEEVLQISFEKGGTSVLADGYLVAGQLTDAQAEFMFGYGAFTQLMDDLEDVQSDLASGSLTLFTQQTGRGPLDGLTNSAFQLGARVFQMMGTFHVPYTAALIEIILKAVDPLLIISAVNLNQYYTKPYLSRLEQYLPFRYAFLRDQKRKLDRLKLSTGDLLKTIAWKM
jgi:hypothetical protein